MSRNAEIRKKVEEALNSLDGLERAAPPAYFFTRLSARMDRKKTGIWEGMTTTLTRPLVAFLSVTLVVVLNVFVVATSQPRQLPAGEGSEIAVAEEYSRVSSIYDLENQMP